MLDEEHYLSWEIKQYIMYEYMLQRYGVLPSQIKNENAEDIEGVLMIALIKDKINPERNIKL